MTPYVYYFPSYDNYEVLENRVENILEKERIRTRIETILLIIYNWFNYIITKNFAKYKIIMLLFCSKRSIK